MMKTILAAVLAMSVMSAGAFAAVPTSVAPGLHSSKAPITQVHMKKMSKMHKKKKCGKGMMMSKHKCMKAHKMMKKMK